MWKKGTREEMSGNTKKDRYGGGKKKGGGESERYIKILSVAHLSDAGSGWLASDGAVLRSTPSFIIGV